MGKSELQERVTHFATNGAVSLKKLAVFVFCITLGVVIALGVVINASGKKKIYIFIEGATFYAYYTEEALGNNIENSVSTQKQSGGAGYPYGEKQSKYICAFLYKSQKDANSVMDANYKEHPQGGVVEIKTTKLSKRAKKIMNSTENYLLLFHFFEDCFNECHNLSISWDNASLTEAKLLSTVLLLLNKANEICEKFETTDDLCAPIELLGFEIKEFMTKTTSKVERSSGVKLLCFKIIELFNIAAEILNNRN